MRRLSIQRASFFATAACLFSLSAMPVSYAQETAPEPRPLVPETGTVGEELEQRTGVGWFGLLGLVGLAGLFYKPKIQTGHVEHTTHDTHRRVS